jgi:hypothetical protein
MLSLTYFGLAMNLKSLVKEIAELTQDNRSTDALLEIAKWFNMKEIVGKLEVVSAREKVGHLTSDMFMELHFITQEIRNKIESTPNANVIWSKL